MTSQKPKKYLWILSTLLPLMGLAGVGLYQLTGYAWMLIIPLLFIYGVIPMLDWVFNKDPSNPDEDQVPILEKMPYYNWILYLMLPLHYAVFIYLVYFMVTETLAWWMYAVLLLTMGVFGGLAVNLGHELGHKKERIHKNLAKLALATGAYGHFNIEHNAGHHRYVATPEDTASAKMGENIYRFAMREYPGGLKRAWRIETRRLQRQEKAWYAFDNQILQAYALTVIIYAVITVLLGWTALLIMLLHAPLVWWQLTSANYIEHYGLLRDKDEHGRYEKCQPRHSWNSNHLISNLVLFHLQRHSDHHANPTRHYQSLRHFEDVLQLPTGYMGMFLLAYVPPLWFKTMDRKLMAMHQSNLQPLNTL